MQDRLAQDNGAQDGRMQEIMGRASIAEVIVEGEEMQNCRMSRPINHSRSF